MQAHQQRVVAEKSDLDDKISKLEKFFATQTFASLGGVDQSLLKNQAYYMKSYSSILGSRIYLFN